MLEKIAYFAAGAVTGGIGVYFVLARKFEQDFQEATIEINKELAEIAEAKHKERVGDGADSEDREPNPEPVVPSAVVDYSPTPVEDSDQEEVTKRTMDRQHFEAYQITEEEFRAKGIRSMSSSRTTWRTTYLLTTGAFLCRIRPGSTTSSVESLPLIPSSMSEA